MGMRIEEDALGAVAVPEDAYYGAQTARAMENSPGSGLRFPPSFITALGLIKKHAAAVNRDIGLLDESLAAPIEQSAGEVVEGKLADQFVLDVFQTGSGTSTNMNANEVVAGRANELLSGRRGGKFPVHPNDHVNLGQSSNDVIPSAIHIAASMTVHGALIPSLEALHQTLVAKSRELAPVMKIGRTHLQDAVPISLGQELSGYGRQVELGLGRVRHAMEGLAALALGGTAVGTGLNAHPRFASSVIARLSEETGIRFHEAPNHFEAQSAQDAVVEASGALRTIAVSLHKIANDIRWLASGPRCGLGEITIPSLQPGSSIMPGKVNPVVPEVVIQVAAQVAGNDVTIAMGGQGGFFELNTMLPVIAYNLLQSIGLLAGAAEILDRKCVRGIEADRERCGALIEQSLALATYLVPSLGYDAAAAIAREAHATGRTIRGILVDKGIMTGEAVDALFRGAHGEEQARPTRNDPQ